ncbi:MAG TPA: cation diffusion facilitator family transporter [Rhodothermales bacterium]|nr:cation diffusion facilitator family transporter [Rhodothermales bacterium]
MHSHDQEDGHDHRGRYSHSHAHAHAHGLEGGGARLLASIVLNLLITIAEVVGGLLSGSLALLSDALHNFSDTTSLGVSYVARRIARRRPTQQMTFGYRRAEIIGAFINLVTLVIIALYLIKEGVTRLLNPEPVNGTVMLAVAVIGLLANLATAFLLFRYSKGSLNIRSAFLHIVGDAVSSVGVVLGSVLITYFDVYVLDPILTIAISVYILYHSYEMLRQTIDILMESTPPGFDLRQLVADVEEIGPVQNVHHVHVWQLDEEHLALEAHVVVEDEQAGRMEEIKRVIKDLLLAQYGIAHSTLEFEFDPCGGAREEVCYTRMAEQHAHHP